MKKYERRKGDKEMEQTIAYVDEFLRSEGTTFQDKIDYEKSKSFDDGERASLLKTANKMLADNLNIKSIIKYWLIKEEIESLK